jgi:hypothetical protein
VQNLILIFPDFFAKYSASGFAILSQLSLKAVKSDVELNSASNDTILTRVVAKTKFDESEVRGP